MSKIVMHNWDARLTALEEQVNRADRVNVKALGAEIARTASRMSKENGTGYREELVKLSKEYADQAQEWKRSQGLPQDAVRQLRDALFTIGLRLFPDLGVDHLCRIADVGAGVAQE